jgi:hypothetical protein
MTASTASSASRPDFGVPLRPGDAVIEQVESVGASESRMEAASLARSFGI